MSMSIEQTVEGLKYQQNPVLEYTSEDAIQAMFQIAQKKGYFVLAGKLQEELKSRCKEKEYPELEKLTKHHDFISSVIEFAEYCESQGVWLLDTKTETTVSPADMVWKMLGIDEKKVEEQRQQLIKDELGE